MERENSWVGHWTDNFVTETVELHSFSEISDEGDMEVSAVSMDLIIPNDLLERILSHLPVASIFRAGCVCKRWHEIVTSKGFLQNFLHDLPQKPWYFMFTSSDEPVGFAYDLVLQKWYGIELPCIQTSNWFVSSSSGLVCVMDNDSRSELYICNPITKCCRRLVEPPGPKFSDYSALAISVNRVSHKYHVSIVRSNQVQGNFFQWDLSIHVYNSETMMWMTTLTEVLTGWRAGDESVICDGILYFLIYSTGGGTYNRHALVLYNLENRSSCGLLMTSSIPVPCSLTCGRLMNLKEKLVMVGGIGKQDRPGIIKGIGIWILNGKEWQEIARMPHRFFQGFGELDEVFASSGMDDLVFIQSYGAPALLIFDVNLKQWRWSQKCPVTKRFPLQLFTGFCFEPKLEIAP
ncbi:F-box/kelch-repeat protein At3g61590-like [Olea europaea var. sylvestris]|uniref:F-box kelch-repeat At3g61590 n=1 Tax=Olea europaea subsp. europaea TaxID=158383 RepID=A0A8S0Q8K6_OLEEU|nr:F-box/kelch-repeat protein At3g61590-like [Olea europaea var. sylvestris]CAA2961426.1 F-box kelch-repeat At3g61590 [Olea europaea subsp. europaea]